MIKKITYYLLTLIIAYIPFYRFFQALLEDHTSLSSSADFWLSHWYEPIIFFLLVLNLVIFLFSRKNKALSKSQMIAILLLLLSFFSIVFLSKTIGRGLEGFRFMMLPLVIYLTVSLADLDASKQKIIIRVYLAIATIMAIWSIAERFFPTDYFVKWGILGSQESWYGSHTVVGVKQGVALFGSPNLLAGYLLPAFFLLISGIKFSKLRLSTVMISLILSLAILLSFSRSAFLGLVIALFLLITTVVKNHRQLLILFLMSLVLVSALFLGYSKGGRQVKDIFTHGASQETHASSLKISIDELKNRYQKDFKTFVFGSGLGSAGPSAMKYGDGIVSESWYFQVLLEVGLVGLLLWLSFFFYSMKKFWRAKERWPFYGLLSILIMTTFLHTLSDNPALSFTLFALLGFSTHSEN
jgi:hypothetical protein